MFVSDNKGKTMPGYLTIKLDTCADSETLEAAALLLEKAESLLKDVAARHRESDLDEAVDDLEILPNMLQAIRQTSDRLGEQEDAEAYAEYSGDSYLGEKHGDMAAYNMRVL